MKHSFEFETLDDPNSFLDPFDNPPAGCYRIKLIPDAAEGSDKVVRTADREGRRSFAKIFAQLADGPYEQGHHLHIDPDEKGHYCRSMRIVLDDDVARSGRGEETKS